MFSNINIKGLSELDASLRNLRIELQRSIAQQSLNAGAKIVKLFATSHVPIGKSEYIYPYGRVRNKRIIGQLKAAIRISKGKARPGMSVRTIAFTKKKTGWYGIFIEKGWIPTGPRKRGYLSSEKVTFKQHRLYARQKGTQKISGRPFMKPALVQNVGSIVDKISEKMKQLIDKETWRVR